MNDVTDITTRLVRRVEDLKVFQVSYKISIEVHRISLSFPQIEQYAIADQIRRASKSICANLSEGFARQSYSSAEFKRFIAVAIGSAAEMKLWTLYCRDLGYIDSSKYEEWYDQFDHVVKMLQKLKNSVKSDNR